MNGNWKHHSGAYLPTGKGCAQWGLAASHPGHVSLGPQEWDPERAQIPNLLRQLGLPSQLHHLCPDLPHFPFPFPFLCSFAS